jgi:hypothetical protein
MLAAQLRNMVNVPAPPLAGTLQHFLLSHKLAAMLQDLLIGHSELDGDWGEVSPAQRLRGRCNLAIGKFIPAFVAVEAPVQLLRCGVAAGFACSHYTPQFQICPVPTPPPKDGQRMKR